MNPRQIFMEAFRLKSQGDLSGALKLYMRVIELDPNCAGAYLNAGAILFRMRRYPDAVKLYRRGLELSPKNLPALLDAAKACEMIGKWDEALRYLDEALSIAPSSKVALRRKERILGEKEAFGSLGEHADDLDRFLGELRREYSERFHLDLPPAEVEIIRGKPPRAPEWSAGMYEGHMRLIVRGEFDPGVTVAIIRHEYAHLALRSVCGKAPPGWMEEGVAEFLSGILNESDRRKLREAALRGDLIPLRELEDLRGLSEGKVRLAYAESGSAVEYLITLLGWEPFLDLLKTAAAEGADRSMRSHLGIGLDEFEGEWTKFILSTSQFRSKNLKRHLQGGGGRYGDYKSQKPEDLCADEKHEEGGYRAQVHALADDQGKEDHVVYELEDEEEDDRQDQDDRLEVRIDQYHDAGRDSPQDRSDIGDQVHHACYHP